MRDLFFIGAALLVGCEVDDGGVAPAVQGELVGSQLLAVGTEPDVCDGVCAPVAFGHQPALVVTDPVVLARFDIRKVLDQLVAMSGSTLNADQTWEQWWSTQRVRAGGDPPHRPYCDDAGSTINGWPIECPRTESLLEFEIMETHTPVALFNRFDLAPMSGANCGEYRIVYALNGAAVPAAPPVDPTVAGGRNFLIFEGVLPNPDPACGLAACLPVAEFWQSLSTEPSSTIRANLLEDFYFNGICSFDPVVMPDHYGMCPGGDCGQIRTNQFIQPGWLLKEFTLSFQMGEMLFTPTTVKANPHVDLFNGFDPAFNTDYSSNIASLLPNPDSIHDIGLATPANWDAGESPADGAGPFPANNYVTMPGSPLDIDTNNALNAFYFPNPVPITLAELDARATTQSCGGCHELSNGAALGTSTGGAGLNWPPSNGFVHVDEGSALSPALTGPGGFLDERATVLTNFLSTTCGSSCLSPVAGPMIVKPHLPSPDELMGPPDFDLVSAEEFDTLRREGRIRPHDTLSGRITH